MIQYQNRWAVVTGASSGLGSRLAVRLADRGMSVLLTGRNQSRLNRVGRDIRQAAPRVAVETIVADHSTSSGISELLNHVGDRPIEVLVNNAGFGSYGRVTGRWLRPETKARAPIEARNEILIPASPERVWDLLTDVEGWPSWYRACQWVRLESNEDSTLSEKEQRLSFRWKAHPVELRSVVVASERPHLFAIIADAPGLHAERKFTLSPAPNGFDTIVVSDEIQVGLLPWLASWYVQPRLHAANDEMFNDLRAASIGATTKVTAAAA